MEGRGMGWRGGVGLCSTCSMADGMGWSRWGRVWWALCVSYAMISALGVLLCRVCVCVCVSE